MNARGVELKIISERYILSLSQRGRKGKIMEKKNDYPAVKQAWAVLGLDETIELHVYFDTPPSRNKYNNTDHCICSRGFATYAKYREDRDWYITRNRDEVGTYHRIVEIVAVCPRLNERFRYPECFHIPIRKSFADHILTRFNLPFRFCKIRTHGTIQESWAMVCTEGPCTGSTYCDESGETILVEDRFIDTYAVPGRELFRITTRSGAVRHLKWSDLPRWMFPGMRTGEFIRMSYELT